MPNDGYFNFLTRSILRKYQNFTMEGAASHIEEAILHGRTDIANLLISKVKATLKSEYGDSNFEDAFDTFMNSKYTNSTTFLHQAVLLSHRDLIRTLLQEGADPSVICEISSDSDSVITENALQTAMRLNAALEANSLSGFSHVFGEMLFQATASSK